jgi:DNA-binding transcriptional LysR family regulator
LADILTLWAPRWLERHAPAGASALYCNSWRSQLAAARAGLGLAALPCFLGDPAPELLRGLRRERALLEGGVAA